ncbi:hypothetical protein AD939_00190 [Gluconobacter oxydans]|nr:hypothetical protein AD939_00190 [Gluconobacter oxydans]
MSNVPVFIKITWKIGNSFLILLNSIDYFTIIESDIRAKFARILQNINDIFIIRRIFAHFYLIHQV